MARGDANKMKRKKKARALQQIFIPKCCQQPRSAGPKPRTDFSLFFSSSSSTTTSSSLSLEGSAFCSILRRRRGSRPEFSSYKDNMSGITAASMDKGCKSFIPIHKEIPKFSLVQCSMTQNGEKRAAFSNSIGVAVTEIEFAQTKVQDTQNKRNDVGCKSGDAAKLFCFPNNSTSQEVTGCDHVGMAPGSTVWAKTPSQMWWPAKIMEERSTPVSTYGNPVRGHILVQYYGNLECAWLDPAGDVSQFEECFEERSCNSMEAFQDALRQALNICKQLDIDPDGLKSAGQHEQSSDAQSDKCIESSSSRTKDEFLESGRGKRKRKPKVHFDEVTFPVKSARKVRRFRIMRYLGLTAPVGSPFSLSSRMATANKSSSLLDI